MCFNLQRDRTGNGLPNINTFCRMFAAANVSSEPKYVHQAGLSSSQIAGQNIKKVPYDVSDPNQNVDTTCNSKLKFT